MSRHHYQPVQIGSKYGKWTVIKEVKKRGKYRMFLCRCDCGVERHVYRQLLVEGESRSCGCGNTKHGMTGTLLYYVFRSMINRCNNPHVPAYQNYGGRGICVCQEWMKDPSLFFKWAMSHGYKKGLDIDRIDNDGDYSPLNCRFTDRRTNSLNRRFTSGKSGYVGVTKRWDRWSARVTVNGNRRLLGTFPYPRFACLMRDKYIRDHNLPHKTQLPEPKAVA